MKNFLKGLALGTAGLLASVAMAAVYYGFNPATGLETTHGALVDGGNPPVLTGCGTRTAVVSGAYSGTVTCSGTSGNLVITFPSAAPNGWVCNLVDVTTPADIPKQASYTTTSATFAGTIVTADVLLWECNGF